jgi:hypothetical protein
VNFCALPEFSVVGRVDAGPDPNLTSYADPNPDPDLTPSFTYVGISEFFTFIHISASQSPFFHLFRQRHRFHNLNFGQ